MCLAQGHNVVMPVRLGPEASLSRVKHSTTKPLCSLNHILFGLMQYAWEGSLYIIKGWIRITLIYMRAHVLMNLLNDLEKGIKCEVK